MLKCLACTDGGNLVEAAPEATNAALPSWDPKQYFDASIRSYLPSTGKKTAAPKVAELADVKTLASKTNPTCSRLSTVQLANGPKRSMGHALGAEKLNFLIRARGRRQWAMAAAPVESCQSVAQRPPGGRIGDIIYTRKRLHRMRSGSGHKSTNSLNTAAH